MHPYLFLSKLFELVGLGHFAQEYPHVIYSWFVIALLMVVGFLATKQIALVPAKMQNFFELIISGLEEFVVDITGEEGRAYFPILVTLFLYILVCNLLGLVPGFFPPTADINTTLSCALVVFVMTHYIGIKFHGVKYIKHFLGPVWWMIPLMLPLEIISHCSRVLSLTIRLFGNMAGHEIVVGILFLLAGAFFAPLPIMVLGVLVAIIQAFVFFLLAVIYFLGSLEHAH